MLHAHHSPTCSVVSVRMLTNRVRFLSQKPCSVQMSHFLSVHLAKSCHNEHMLGTLKQTAELVEVFRTRGKELSYKKGEFIIRPGDTPPGVFYIYKGLVKAYDITKYGEENLLIIRKEHELFPLIWAITGQERHVIYEAITQATVWHIPREKFVAHMQSHPEALAPLLDMTIEMYRLHSERILNLEYRTVRERIISFLLTMAQRFGTKTDAGTTIGVPLRHQDI